MFPSNVCLSVNNLNELNYNYYYNNSIYYIIIQNNSERIFKN